MKNYKSAAQIILKHAKEFLNTNQTMTIPQLKEYVHEQTGENFSNGCYTAITRLVESPEYSTIERGVYAYNPDKVIKLQLVINKNYSINEGIVQVLANTIEKLMRLAKVNIVDKSEEEFKRDIAEVAGLREVITKIEELKTQTYCRITSKTKEAVTTDNMDYSEQN